MSASLTRRQALNLLTGGDLERFAPPARFPSLRYGADAPRCAVVAVEAARILAEEARLTITAELVELTMNLVTLGHDEIERILAIQGINYREFDWEKALATITDPATCHRCGSDAFTDGVCQFCGEKAEPRMTDELRDQISRALDPSNESYDAEHDALFAVAEHFGIEVPQ